MIVYFFLSIMDCFFFNFFFEGGGCCVWVFFNVVNVVIERDIVNFDSVFFCKIIMDCFFFIFEVELSIS